MPKHYKKYCSGARLRVYYIALIKTCKIPRGTPYSWPNYGILRVYINLLDENVFQNPQIYRKTLRLSPELSTLL
jgi:hypothetical protein